MLPWLALTYTAAHLGFEAQNAAAFRLLRLGRGITKMAADEIVPEVPPHRCSSGAASGRAKKASCREEDLQKIGGCSEARQAG